MTFPFSPTKAQADLIRRMRIASAKALQPGTITVQANADGETGEILIYDVIGFDPFGDSITAKDFAQQVKDLGDVARINVRINSSGGDVFDGMAIYNLLVRHPAQIIVDVDGIAASIASVIAMAGNVIRMPQNSTMMIHDAFGIVIGNEKDMREFADILSKMDGQIAGVYARRSKLSDAEARTLMDDGTLFTGSEAVEAGLADELTEPVKAAAQFDAWQFYNGPPKDSANPVDATVEAAQESVPVEEARAKHGIVAPQTDAADDAERLRAEAEAVAVRSRLLEIDGDCLVASASE